ncbi:hypothetical protein FACS1894152_5980 [Bacilli bacterium]|nr:hypothetical protein FACS1894152_5980 [Bacilli bacterium]
MKNKIGSAFLIGTVLCSVSGFAGVKAGDCEVPEKNELESSITDTCSDKQKRLERRVEDLEQKTSILSGKFNLPTLNSCPSALEDEKLRVKVKKLDSRAIIPEYKSTGAAGMDLHVLLDEGVEKVVIKPEEVKLFNVGFAMELPEGYEAQIRSRSGMALKHNIVVHNSPATIDSDSRGDVGPMIRNCGKEDFVVTNYMRLAQMVITKHSKAELEVVSELGESERGTKGFGSTGAQ